MYVRNVKLQVFTIDLGETGILGPVMVDGNIPIFFKFIMIKNRLEIQPSHENPNLSDVEK